MACHLVNNYQLVHSSTLLIESQILHESEWYNIFGEVFLCMNILL